jgi:hypothetical protein
LQYQRSAFDAVFDDRAWHFEPSDEIRIDIVGAVRGPLGSDCQPFARWSAISGRFACSCWLSCDAGCIRSAADEIQVYTDDIDKPGQFGLELHLNTTPSGRSTPDYPGEVTPRHGIRVTPEFSYGLPHNLELGLYLPFVRDANGTTYLAGTKVRLKWLLCDPRTVGRAGSWA